jgi:hypothetical protein
VVFVSVSSGLAGECGWVEETAHLYDVVHWRGDVQGLTADQAAALVDALRTAGKPLVVSVPADVLETALPAFGPPPRGDDERVDAFAVLVAAAAALLATDGGSAEAVWRVWGRSCLVVAEGGEEEAASANLYRAVVAQEPLTVGGPLLSSVPRPTGPRG